MTSSRTVWGGVRAVKWLLLTIAAFFFVLHYVHLRADFPNHSPWVDWAKYTDEGWYGDAAIRFYLRGKWHVPGDFNPAAALPVWPLLEGLVFGITGVSIEAARALSVTVYLCNAAVVYLLMARRPIARASAVSELTPAVAVLMLSVSPFIYTFSRMAIVEPLLILLTLLAMLIAWSPREGAGEIARRVVLGLLMALMIGTKTTAVFLMPAVMWMIWCGARRQWREAVRVALTAGAACGVVIAAYLLAVTLSGHWTDFEYLFTANQTSVEIRKLWPTISATLSDTMWTGPMMGYLALFSAAVATLLRRRIWNDPLFTGCALWAGGYFVFLTYHASLQPRYYSVIALPILMVAIRGLEDVCLEWEWASIPAAVLMTVIATVQGTRTIEYVRHPEFTFARAAEKVKQLVLAEKGHSDMVLSISGSDLTLMTGLPSICDDFGTLELNQRVAKYKPGWFIAWNYIEDDKMEALSGLYHVTRVAEFPAMDDPDRNLLIVYRLDSKR